MPEIVTKILAVGVLTFGLAACGGQGLQLGKPSQSAVKDAREFDPNLGTYVSAGPRQNNRGTIWELFQAPDPNVNVRVNKYIWNASLETLSFLPVETVDPFTGVLVFGWGRAPGSSQTYRATVLVQDPALEARSLKVSVQTRGGAASAETNRRIEDAILTRARQLRTRQSRL